VPLDAELEVLVRVEPLGVDAELRHGSVLGGVVGTRVAAGSWRPIWNRPISPADSKSAATGRGPPVSVSPAICWIDRMTNSAGLSGAKPTRMLTIPRLTSFWVVVSLSHLTK